MRSPNRSWSIGRTPYDCRWNFIKTGNPNGADLPQWEPLKPANDLGEIMMLDVVSKSVLLSSENRYRLLDRLYGNN